MRLITIQHINVLNTLKEGKIYTADIARLEKCGKSNLIKPYEIMMEHYNYNTVPVFCGVLNRKVEFYGANTTNCIILELEVPDDEVKLQVYYDWVDVIFFTEQPSEWYSGSNIPLEQFINNVLDGENTNEDRAIQATIPYIKPSWLVGCYKFTDWFKAVHYGSGGANILTQKIYTKKPIAFGELI